jgi:hypothetical protein
METISNSVWQRKGSSIVFDQISLGPFIEKGSIISLRQLMSWAAGLPANSPVSGKTILVAGLETVVETMAYPDVDNFLARRIRPIIIDIQSRWSTCGVLFGFSAHPKAFGETSLEEEVLFHRRDKQSVRLSEGLWDGTAATSMKRIVREGDRPASEITVGYYVARIS